MSEPWTPGPWLLFEPTDDGYGHSEWTISGPMQGIDNVYLKEADARLIALAPEMAELLERLTKSIPDIGSFSVALDQANEARAILARARGEVPAST